MRYDTGRKPELADETRLHRSVTIRTEKVSRKIDEGILVSIRRDDERND